MDLQNEVEDVKKELTDLIVLHLKQNSIPLNKARELATEFMSIFPVKNQKDLLDKLKNLGDKYPEAEKVYVDQLDKAEVIERDRVLFTVRDLISQGKMDQAISTSKTLTERKDIK